MVDAAKRADTLAELGSMEAVKLQAFDQLMEQIDRGEVLFDGKDDFIQQNAK